MKTIIIACAGGATSGLLGNKVLKEAEKEGIKGGSIWMADLDNEEMYREAIRDKKLFIIYGPAQAITKENIEKYKGSMNILPDYIFIAPQMRHIVDIIKKDCGDMVGIESIGFQDFGMMRGEKILQRIKEVVVL